MEETKEVIAVALEDVIEIELGEPVAPDGEEAAQVVLHARAEDRAEAHVVDPAAVVTKDVFHPASDDEAGADHDVEIPEEIAHERHHLGIMVEVGVHHRDEIAARLLDSPADGLGEPAPARGAARGI